jgi:alanyl-tRNA synthetase
MATIKLYDKDAYQTAFDGTVLSSTPSGTVPGQFEIILDRTLFFPEEGGQQSDHGTLDDAAVSHVQINAENIITHFTDRSIPSGSPVHGTVHWDDRFDRMQQHTGEHIFSGLVSRRFGYRNVGFRLSEDVTTMDYSGVLTPAQVEVLETEANACIVRNLEVQCSYPSPTELADISYRSKIEIEGPIRIVTIPGVDCCACCAPHVHRTGEIGLLKVIKQEKNRGGTRLTILCGSRALADYREKQKTVEAVSAALSAGQSAIPRAVDRLKEENGSLKYTLSGLRTALMEDEVRKVPAGAVNVCLFTEDLPEPVIRGAVNELTASHDGYCGIFSRTAEGWYYIVGIRNGDARLLNAEMKKQLYARGGGSAAMVQGFVTAAEDAIRNLFC